MLSGGLKMQSISVAQAKNQLTHYLHLVEQGEQIEITRHGKAVAYICDKKESGTQPSNFELAYKNFRNQLENDGFSETEWHDIFDIPRIPSSPLRHPEDFE